MVNFDLTPLYRTTVPLVDRLGSLFDTAARPTTMCLANRTKRSSLSTRTRTASAWRSRGSAGTT